ncbi:helix-turn-helix domain-containing protein [Xenorhabdus bovienii]|uniref:helix-turn-helix domain-containing protein n=1 Tax=Xenorhabdus bovienii TaxID=40576 RepID=UPI0023B2AC2B|nr:XRE family transcriptional regulator [Xenorhabdus bovienii]MDE9460909.1 XRE family transcriptional regulator [Xenorhabdus bovienii]MDE9468354.1 XRE family transcriptional regulator [Xenorhabdus bovienii]
MFNGSNLRLARLYHELSLEQVAEQVGKTRQYIQRLESGYAVPTNGLANELASVLQVMPEFFDMEGQSPINEEIVHFRKRSSTRIATKLSTLAKAELYRRLIDLFEKHLNLPVVKFPEIKVYTQEDIEKAAEQCRIDWGLGFGPIDNMTRLAEKLGAFVTSFDSASDDVDALSVPLARPFIVRNTAKKSPCRQRFDIAHEVAHLILHGGISTGDRITESQANRFASALLLPRTAMAKYFPRPIGGRIDWRGLSNFKLMWKVSKAAIIYRAHQLSLLSDAQYKTAFLGLKRKGEAIDEKEDYLIQHEKPELFHRAIKVLLDDLNIDIRSLAQSLSITPAMLIELANDDLLTCSNQEICSENVVSIFAYRNKMA